MFRGRMKPIVLLVALACVVLGVPAAAVAASGLRPDGVPAEYPNKEIQYIYAFSPGSIQDAYIRKLADKIQKMEGWKHGIIVTYREGASGRIGWSALAKARPDGYSIGFAPSAMLISSVAENAPYGHDKLSFVFNMMTDPGAIGVVADSPYKTLGELVADAKKRPGEVSVAVTSTIGQEGLTLKLIEKEAGCTFNIIPFDGESGVFAAIVGKHVDAFCLNVGDTTTLVEDGKIRVLSTGNTERSSFLPDVPTYKEAGYDVIQVNMRSVAGPAGMPEPIRQYLENCFLAAAEDPEIKAQVASLKIPVDTKKGSEVKQKFADITQKLQALWKEAPWQ